MQVTTLLSVWQVIDTKREFHIMMTAIKIFKSLTWLIAMLCNEILLMSLLLRIMHRWTLDHFPDIVDGSRRE